MDKQRIRQAALNLEREVAIAQSVGYENADCVFTQEVKELLLLAKDDKLEPPVELRFTAGPAWNFSETNLGDCKALEGAWAKFRAAVEDWESRPSYQAVIARFQVKE